MKLTQRQLNKIIDLINKESEIRKNLHESMYENRKKSIVQESFLFEDADPNSMPEHLASALDNEMTNYSQSLLSTINKKVYKELSNMYYDMTGSSIDPNVLQDNLEEFDVYEHEMELMTDIKAAIDRYILAIGKAAVEESGVNASGGREHPGME